MSGLVAYDGSGSSSEDEDEVMTNVVESKPTENANVTVVNNLNGTSGTSSSSTSSKPSVIFSKFMDDDEYDDEMGINLDVKNGEDNEVSEFSDLRIENDSNPVWSKFLPQPKKVPVEVVEEEDDLEIGPIPPKKTYGDEELPPPKTSSIASLTATKVQGKVRISIPFLSSLIDEEPSEEEPRKFMQPAKKGSGLFAVLPQPKNTLFREDSNSNVFITKTSKPTASSSQPQTLHSSKISETHQASTSSLSRLVPDSVKNKLKRPAPDKLAEIKAKYIKKDSKSSTSVNKQNDSDGSDEEGGGFFSLDAGEIADPEMLEKLKLPDIADRVQTPVASTFVETMDQESEYLSQEASSSSNTSQSSDLMKFIQPKKGRKEDVQIIDINADDLRPDNTEWLKNITDESAAPPRRGKGLGGMVKRKHQITYLAFEAKAREQELKNQWAQNRANKMATKNKYGF